MDGQPHSQHGMIQLPFVFMIVRQIVFSVESENLPFVLILRNGLVMSATNMKIHINSLAKGTIKDHTEITQLHIVD